MPKSIFIQLAPTATPSTRDGVVQDTLAEMFGPHLAVVKWVPGEELPEYDSLIISESEIALDTLPRGVLYLRVMGCVLHYVGAGTGTALAV